MKLRYAYNNRSWHGEEKKVKLKLHVQLAKNIHLIDLTSILVLGVLKMTGWVPWSQKDVVWHSQTTAQQVI